MRDPVKFPFAQRAGNRVLRRSIRWIWRKVVARLFKWLVRALVLVGLLVLAMRWVNPPITITQIDAYWYHGQLARSWRSLDSIAPALQRAAVAGEDANFCNHYGFDIAAIRAVLQSGAGNGASTISQQGAKNVFLWQGRSWFRKGLEAGFTGLIELLWGKRRILEVYLNVAEFDTATFGAEAASQAYFGKHAADLTEREAAGLVTVLPNPKERSASAPSSAGKRRAAAILSGARPIAADGRDACFSTGRRG